MNLKEIGEILRTRREAMGLTIDDVMEKTKISRRNIVGIEEGRSEDLPHAVYAKGFIRNYAHLLGMSSDETEELLNGMLADSEVPRSDLETEEHLKRNLAINSEPEPRSKKKMGPAIIAFIILLLLAAGGLFLLKPAPGNNGANQTEAPAVEESTAPAVEQEEVVPAPTNATEVDESVSEAVAPSANATAADETVSENAQDEAASTPEAPVAEAAAAEESADAELKLNTVRISAQESCWVAFKVDGEGERDMNLRPGNSIALRYTDNIWLRFGNGGGVTVTNNGKTVPLNAGSGQVRTVSLP